MVAPVTTSGWPTATGGTATSASANVSATSVTGFASFGIMRPFPVLLLAVFRRF